MSNFMDYFDWRGDLTFDQSPFCEVDNLVLAYVSYVKLEGIVPEPDKGSITLAEASKRFFEKYSEEELKKDRSFIRLVPYMMQKMATTTRFKDVVLQNMVNEVDTAEEVQFAALELLLPDGTSYISFRGTDDTIVGWKEDFELSNGTVPAEKQAAEYLNYVGQNAKKNLRVGGHSKGGNLAVYAAADCDVSVQYNILEVYNNDGPGFTEEFLQNPGLLRIKSRIRRYIPESSVIGMLLNHIADPVILKSTQKGPLQHDGFSWEVLGNQFLHCEELSKTGVIFDETLRSWIDEMNVEDRKAFIDDFFSVLEAPGVETLTELQDGGLKSVKAMFTRVDELNPETRKKVEELLKGFLSHWRMQA